MMPPFALKTDPRRILMMSRLLSRRLLMIMALLGSAAAQVTAGGLNETEPGGAAPALELAGAAKELALTKGLAVGLIGSYGRAALPTDLLA